MQQVSHAAHYREPRALPASSCRSFEPCCTVKALDFTPSKAALRSLIQEADPQLTGFVDFEGFKGIMAKHAASIDPSGEVDKIFKLIAGNATSISLANLREAAHELGENMSDDDLSKLVELLGSESRAAISKEEFARIMLPKKGGEDNLDSLDD